jgi:T-complex protein 1 subunit gamma
MKEDDFTRLLQIEEEFVQKMCSEIIKFKPDLLITEKGISDLAQHYLVKANISCIRRVKKTDNNRIARATGATIVYRTDEIREEDIGLQAGLFEIQKIGDEYVFAFVNFFLLHFNFMNKLIIFKMFYF